MRTFSTFFVVLFSFVGVSTAQTQVGPFLLFQGSGFDASAHTVIPWENGVVMGGRFLTYNDSLHLNGVAFLKDGVLSPLGSGPLLPSANAAVTTLVKVQGDLYALGRFAFPALSFQPQSVTRWTGTEWISLPGFFEEENNPHFAAVEFEGTLVMANGRTIRRWANNRWTILGQFNGNINALAVYRGELIAGGAFAMSGDLNRLARWDGQRWLSMDVGVSGTVNALLVHQDTLYAAGEFVQEGFPFPDVRRLNRVAQWKNGGWYPLGNGIPHAVSKLTVSEGRLVALRLNPSAQGTPFSQAETVAARWNGTEWQQLNLPFSGIRHLRDMLQLGEKTVYVGEFLDETAAVSHVAVETGSQLMLTLEPRLANGLFTFVSPMVNYRGEMVVVGTHRHALFPKHSLATWNERNWNIVDTRVSLSNEVGSFSPNPELSTLYVHNDTLYYARTHRVFAYDGAQWAQVGQELPGGDFTLAMQHHNTSLYIGGRFVGGLAKLEGERWVFPLALRNVNALHSFGEDLIIGGEFSVRVDRNGMLNRIARLTPDGQFFPLGDGFNNNVQALSVFNGELYAAGDFTASGNTPIFKIARWDGQEWQPVGRGINGNVYSLSVVDGHLVAYGRGVQLSVVGSPDIRGAARWNGSEWLPLVEGWSSGIYGLLERNGILYISGEIFNVDGRISRGLVAWDGRTNVSAPTASLPLAGAVSVYPQPASRTVTLQFPIEAPGSTLVEIYDLLGRLRFSVSENSAGAGHITVQLDLSVLEPGTYVYRANPPGRMHTGTIIRTF